jgi:hypothetical protein
MSERNQTAWAVALGAAVGGAVAYLFLTEGGRRIRRQIEPQVGALLGDLRKWGALDLVRHVPVVGALAHPLLEAAADRPDRRVH